MAKFDVDSFFEEEKGVDYSVTAPEGDVTELDFSHDEKNKVKVINWKQPLFSSLHNPNHGIFVVETQQGADEDDQGHGSIGDATMAHVSKMSHRLPEMESFFRMPNGNLFRTVPNVQPMDEDGERYNKKQMMEVMVAHDPRVSLEDKENVIAFLQEEIAERREAREEKQDALDQVVIPYDQWEAMPQMTRDWDIPPTQAPVYVYAGNTSQPFYDHVPEDHPDQRRITQFILMVNNVDWDDFTEDTATYFKMWLLDDERKFSVRTTAYHLADFCDEVADPDGLIYPDDLMKACLQKIDAEWMGILHDRVVKTFQESPITRDLERFEKSLAAKHEKGNLVWAEIGRYGQNLYRKYGSHISTPHWTKYRKLKARFAPKVVVNKLDVNRADYRDLSKTMPKKQADFIYFNRPFMSLEDLVEKKAVTLESVGYTKNNVVFISMIKSTAKKSIQSRVPSLLGKTAQQIINTQQTKPSIMTEEEWSAVWQTYRIAKAEVKSHLGLTS
jgi:hypothetical protein